MKRMAFTLVELLVVLLILAILLGLVVGISKYIMAEAASKQTVATQRIVMLAVERYQETEGSYPPDDSSCTTLMTTLHSNDASSTTLLDLPEESWAARGKPLKDGFGENMAYERSGGFGGTPILISKGPDREFNTADDIRSDK